MSGEARGIGARVMRVLLRLFEPFYALAMRVRNTLYDKGIKRQHRLAWPVISIGNITTGGTGKTPAVQWIARKLLALGHHPACLLRGYKVGTSTTSDEATLLERSLGIPVRANPDRVESARKLIESHPETDVILLDDGFQHRRVHRDLDIVLIDATKPFGYGHVLPRGMLREALVGLRRAHVLILTRSDLVTTDRIGEIESRLRRYNSAAPILRAQHRITSLLHGDESMPLESLRGRNVFSFCGIANPKGFHDSLLGAGAIDAGHRWFADHHDYSRGDIEALTVNAEFVVTTEKDWVKIEPLLTSSDRVKIWRARMAMEFGELDARELLARIESVTAKPASSSAR